MITYSEYKGHPVVTLTIDGVGGHGFTFGLGKAMLVLANIEELRAWAAKENEQETICEITCPDCSATWVWAHDMSDMPYKPSAFTESARCPACKDADAELAAALPLAGIEILDLNSILQLPASIPQTAQELRHAHRAELRTWANQHRSGIHRYPIIHEVYNLPATVTENRLRIWYLKMTKEFNERGLECFGWIHPEENSAAVFSVKCSGEGVYKSSKYARIYVNGFVQEIGEFPTVTTLPHASQFPTRIGRTAPMLEMKPGTMPGQSKQRGKPVQPATSIEQDKRIKEIMDTPYVDGAEALETLARMKKASYQGCYAPRENVIKWSAEALAKSAKSSEVMNEWFPRRRCEVCGKVHDGDGATCEYCRDVVGSQTVTQYQDALMGEF